MLSKEKLIGEIGHLLGIPDIPAKFLGFLYPQGRRLWSAGSAIRPSLPGKHPYMQLGMKEDQLPKHKKLSIKRWIDKINNAVNKPGSKGPGTNFTIELQESSRKDRTDLLIIQKSSEYLSTGSRAK